MTTLGVEATGLYALARAAKSKAELEQIEHALWREYHQGKVSGDEAQEIAVRIVGMKGPGIVGRAVGAVAVRLSHRLVSRQRPRCPDRAASRARRRQLGGCGAISPSLRPLFTEAQRSVLTIYASAVKLKGFCDYPIDKVAALAGVCRTTVQTTQHEARRLGFINVAERPRPGQKSLTNVVTIVSGEWLNWIKRSSLKAARDRVQIADTAQKDEPHEETEGIEEERRSPFAAGQGGRSAVRHAVFDREARAVEGRRPAGAGGDAPAARRAAGWGVVSDFGPVSGTGGGRNAR